MEELEKKAQELLEKGFAKNLEEAKKAASDMLATEAKKISDAVDAKLKEVTEKHTEEVKSLTVKIDERDKEISDALTKMNRIQEAQKKERVKSFSEEIGNTLEAKSSDIKNYAQGVGKKSLDIALSMDTKAVSTIGVVSGLNGEWAGVVGPAYEVDHLRNRIQVIPTQRDLIKYLRFTAKEGAIGMVAPGALKPKFDYTPTVEEAPVRKIAGILDVVDEFLEDTPGAIEFLRTELPQRLLEVEDAQILKGDGTGQNLEGLFTVATALTLPTGTVAASSNAWDKLAAAMIQVRRAKRVATAAWVSPEVYLELMINKDTTEGYTYPVLMNAAGQLTIGGVPVFMHSALSATEGIIGDFASGVKIFQRSNAVINFSTENKDNFETNVTSIRIEERIALPIYFPDGFVKVDFTVGV